MFTVLRPRENKFSAFAVVGSCSRRLLLLTPEVYARRLLNMAIDSDKTDSLFEACERGNLDLVNELLKQGIAPTIELLQFLVEIDQVKIVDFLRKNVDLSQVINQPCHYDNNHCGNGQSNTAVEESGWPNSPVKQNGPTEGNKSLHIAATKKYGPTEGDRPLHIAARNKYVRMVDVLLKVKGVDKKVENNEGLTPLDIAREVTEYHDSYKIITQLADHYPQRRRPFMYNAPNMSQEKRNKAWALLDQSFKDRENAQSVVAALFATMTFTAAFTLPGGFLTEPEDVIGSPALINNFAFKIFLLFDCAAFFLSLFAVINMFHMSSQHLSTEDKMWLKSVNSGLLFWTFVFMAYGFMAGVYAMVAHRAKVLSWMVLGSLSGILWCGSVIITYGRAKDSVDQARFHRLLGLARRSDDVVAHIWHRAERCQLLYYSSSVIEMPRKFISGVDNDEGGGKGRGRSQSASPMIDRCGNA